MNIKKKILIGMGAVALTASLSSCGQAPWESSLRDLEGAEVRNPNVTIWNNVDLHPNIARVCTDGVAFATTTRDFVNVIRVPEWDAYCADHLDRLAKAGTE